MSLLRLKSWLAVGTLVLTMTSVASAQKYQPFGPVDWEQYHDMQPFAPADVSDYDLGPPPKEGFFASYDRMYLSIGQPQRAEVGAPGIINPSIDAPPASFQQVANTLDTSFIHSEFIWADRIELGYTEGKHGWLGTYFQTTSQWQGLSGPSDPAINFFDPNTLLTGYLFGTIPPFTPFPLAAQFSAVDLKNVTRLTGVELLHTYRFNPDRWGSDWQLFCGARYLQLNDEFDVFTHEATGPFGVMSRLLDGSFWNTLFQNNMIGPELGLRMANRRERWNFVAEGRFTAAANFIDGTQDGAFFVAADQVSVIRNFSYLGIGNTRFNNSTHEESFAPIVEFRLESSYELTKAIAFKFGYTALWMDGIARASNRVLYKVSDMGFTQDGHEDLFVNGVTFGIEINR